MTDFPPRERAAYPIFHRLMTRWRDDDVYGHMNNVVYYEYFDTAVNRWLVASGALEVPNGPVVGLVAETGCRYFASVGFPDELEIGLSTMRVGGSSVIYGLGLFRAGEAEVSAACRFVHVYVDTATRKPTPLPDSFRAALGALAPRG
ncbi:MAG: thioesterase family protein [Pseudomonadota bacterium]